MDKIQQILKTSVQLKETLMQDSLWCENLALVIDRVSEAFRNGKRVYFCGNGGSAADAQHLAAEFSGRFYRDRDPLPSEALHVNTSYLTAVGNDYGFEQVYARLIRGIGQAGDILFGISTSGNSPNIILALKEARSLGLCTIAMTGRTGGRLRDCCDYLIAIPSEDTPRIQECHILAGHILCELVEAKLFPL